MAKLPMCRICLVEDVRMYVVVNKNLHELYKKLTDVPFVTEDSRPMLACYFCCTKLKHCWRFWRKCVEAEELFAQMMNEDYEADPSMNPGHLEFFNGFSNSQIELINIVDGGQIVSEAIKEEFPDVSERLDDYIDPEEEHLTNKLQLEDVDNSYPDVEDTPALHAESDSENIPLMEIATEVEDDPESTGSLVAKKPKMDGRRKSLRNIISAEQKKNENNRTLSCVSKTIKNTPSKRIIKFKEPFTKTRHEVNSSINNTVLGASCRNNSNRDEIKCKISNKGVDSDDLKRYQRVCAKEKRFECNICHRSFSRKSVLTRHTRIHTGEKPFKCDKCQRKFSQKSVLSKHERTRTCEKLFKCDICQRRFSQKSILSMHILCTHTGEKRFKCDVCQRRFNKKCDLTKHVTTHTGEKPFKCDICQRRFNQKSNLVCHIRTHTGEKLFQCDICQRRFSQKRVLSSHVLTHAGEKLFKCDICQRSFSQKGNLECHIRIHTGAKLFQCDICQRRFSQKSILSSHVRTHTGEKPFKCDICQRSFNQKSNLVNHIRTHTREKPFKCDICQHSFSQKGSLTRHLGVHTGEKSSTSKFRR